MIVSQVNSYRAGIGSGPDGPDPGGELWTPEHMTTTQWLDAADDDSFETGDGGSVSVWRDRSGNGRDAVQATEANQPIRVAEALNGLAVVRGDGVSDILATNYTGFPYQDSLFIVYRTGVSASRQALYSRAAGGSQEFTLRLNYRPGVGGATAGDIGTWIVNGGQTRAFYASVGAALYDSAAHILHLASDNSEADAGAIHFDGEQRAIVDVETGTVGTGNFSAGNLGIGGRFSSGTPSEWLDGDLAEIIRAPLLGATNRQRAEGYLAHKWGLAANLPAGHPYKSAPPTV